MTQKFPRLRSVARRNLHEIDYEAKELLALYDASSPSPTEMAFRALLSDVAKLPIYPHVDSISSRAERLLARFPDRAEIRVRITKLEAELTTLRKELEA